MFSDCTDFIGHSKIYNNDLFIIFVNKKEKAHKRALQIAMPQLLHHFFLVLPYSLPNIFSPNINIHIPKINNNHIEVYMTSQSINSETITIPKLNTYETK